MKTHAWLSRIKLNMTVIASAALVACAGHAGHAYAGPGGADGIFENSADAAKVKAGIKRDIFYTDGELAVMREKAAQREAEARQAAGMQSVTVQTAAPQAPAPGPAQANVPPSPETSSTSPVEIFKVDGIIKIGGRGCAIINSKLWFVGEKQLGYEVVGLTDETVKMKTPAGKVEEFKLERPAEEIAKFKPARPAEKK